MVKRLLQDTDIINRAVQKGVAHEYYTEFKNFVACGRGLRKDIKSKINYYVRTISFLL